jgi:hypothetical protein
MKRLGFLAAATLLALAGPAAARCNQPYAPTVKVGASATKSDIATLHDDVTSFIKASDIYQKCLIFQKAPSQLIEASQAHKERVAREYNALMKAFRAAHPE